MAAANEESKSILAKLKDTTTTIRNEQITTDLNSNYSTDTIKDPPIHVETIIEED